MLSKSPHKHKKKLYCSKKKRSVKSTPITESRMQRRLMTQKSTMVPSRDRNSFSDGESETVRSNRQFRHHTMRAIRMRRLTQAVVEISIGECPRIGNKEVTKSYHEVNDTIGVTKNKQNLSRADRTSRARINLCLFILFDGT